MSVQAGTSFTITSLKASLNGNYTLGEGLFSANNQLSGFAQGLAYAFGAAVGKVNQIVLMDRTVAASATDTIVFSALANPDGSAFNPARIKAIGILLEPGTPAASALKVGPGATGSAVTHPWIGPFHSSSDWQEVRNGPTGGVYLNACGDATGWATVPATSDEINVVNEDGANAANYVLLLLGCDS